MQTSVTSQAIHSSPSVAVGSRRVRLPGNMHTCFDSLVRVSRHSTDNCTHVGLPGPCFVTAATKEHKKLFIRCVTVWEPGTGGQDVETRSPSSHFPNDEMDTVPNSQVRERTVMASGAPSDTEGGMMFNWSRLWLWAATLHGDRESRRLRPWTSSTRHRDYDSHKKLSRCEPLQFKLRSGARGALARLPRVSSPIWQARRPAASER